MKRLIAAGILFVFVITVYIFGYVYITKTCDTATDMLNECSVLYDKNKNAEDCANKLKKFWNNKEGTLSIFANHEHIDDIELAIGSLVIYSNTNNNKKFYEYLSTAKTLIHQLIEESKPSMHSILWYTCINMHLKVDINANIYYNM